MEISGEQKRLEIVRQILAGQSFQGNSIPVQLVVGTEDADDCAVYDLPGNLSLVIGTDFIRGTGFILFQRHYLSYFDIGYYLVIANLSDIAAMGATPIGLTTVVRYNDTLDDADFRQLLEGIQEAASFYNTPIIGGDIGGYGEVVLAATAFGITERGKYLQRKGTLESDILCITGQPGLPSTALVYFTQAKNDGLLLSEEEEYILLQSWRRPLACIQEGLALTGLGIVHACQDVSDGVKATIDQLAKASNISFELYEAQLPIHAITKKVANFLKIDPIALAFSASVDFHLMFTIAQQDVAIVKQTLALLNCTLYQIGQAISATEPSYLVRSDGRRSAVPGTAWQQQPGDVTRTIIEGL
jgi:thiamine-monophosphate kinase